ncbi:MAG TPA: MerR family transcriptional regulator [Chloroflexota bacterium]|nr:MerR family transcriptional regulator [Chloroflexota bacterium]
MDAQGEELFVAHEFAARAGVTVRALHHYDRIGLLKPGRRSESGYRLYGQAELVRLQQIAALKFVGFSLGEIRDLLERNPLELPAALRLQRRILAERRQQLLNAEQAISQAETLLAATGSVNWDAIRQVIQVMEMQENWDWVKTYYTPEQLEELARRGTPEVIAKGQQDWAELIRDVETAVQNGVNPKSAEGQALAARWQALIDAFTGGNSGIAANLQRVHENWPKNGPKLYSDEVGKFIEEARR